MKLSTFCIVKNESQYIGYGIMSVLDYVDEMIFADGNSEDGTIEIIEYIKKKYDKHDKIKLFKNKDCKNLKEDYVRLFNFAIKKCTGDYVWFLHPDMICVNPERIREQIKDDIRYSVQVVSFAGENAEKYFEKGRSFKWFTIYKNDFGLHYHGYYGSADEDLYFRDFTGDNHVCHDFVSYLPYKIVDTDIKLFHYCDTKPLSRRIGRMKKVLQICFPGNSDEWYDEQSQKHPRVVLKDGDYNGQRFVLKDYDGKKPEVFGKYKEFEKLRRKFIYG